MYNIKMTPIFFIHYCLPIVVCRIRRQDVIRIPSSLCHHQEANVQKDEGSKIERLDQYQYKANCLCHSSVLLTNAKRPLIQYENSFR